MVIKGRKSGKEYTAEEQLDVLKKLVRTIADVKQDIQAMNESIADAKTEYCEEFFTGDEDRKIFNKETKKMIDLEVKALLKEDRTEENAIDRLVQLKEDVASEREGR